MTAVVVSCIVEGQGESGALPVLVRRIAEEVTPGTRVDVPRPIRVPKNRLVKAGQLEREIENAARKVDDRGGVLLLIDADDDCPASVGPELLHRARQTRDDKLIGVVLAKREFEAWFLAGAPSLGGRRGLRADIEAPSDPEAIRGAKEWLKAHQEAGIFAGR
ncbi:MAG TPA: DUF4276 family protein [Acidimicrobiales bacterium]|nr:DUF4276 family protein [Acidimicrobiales bacterium]